MFPKNSTPIKNFILTDIIAKGKLTLTEIRIVAYIIRWSWGFSNGDRRKDFTPELSISKIAKDIGLTRQQVSRTLNQMIKEKKIIRDGKKYQFNEHYEDWITDRNNQLTPQQSVDTTTNTLHKPQQIVYTKRNNYLTQSATNSLHKPQQIVDTQQQEKPEQEKESRTPKENIKKSIKKTYKEKNNTSTNVDVDVKKPNPVYQLVEDFALFRGIPLDRGFINKNVQHAKRLLKQYPPEFIAQVIKWRLENDDGFWHSKLNNLGIVYTHIAEWIGEMKRGKKIVSFKKFLEQNPHLDYRDLEKGSKEREIALWRALREAYKSGYVEFTPKMLEVYKSFIEDFERRKF